MGYAAKIRRCIRGCKQRVQYEDSVFASTPQTSSLKIMMSLSLPYNWIIHAPDITTSFLHVGQLHELGDTANMIGRMLQRSSNDCIMIYESADCYTPIFKDYELQRANSANAPCTSSLRPDDSIELLRS